MAKKVSASAENEQASPNFENVLTNLEQIVTFLESGELPLQEALKEFERGVQLSRLAQQQLQSAEQRVQILLNESAETPLTFYSVEEE